MRQISFRVLLWINSYYFIHLVSFLTKDILIKRKLYEKKIKNTILIYVILNTIDWENQNEINQNQLSLSWFRA